MQRLTRLSLTLLVSATLATLAAGPGTAAPHGPLPCAEEARTAVGDIRTLVLVSGLPGGNENALLAKLDAAGQSVDKGNANAASGQLGALRNQVQAFAANGTLSAEDARAILEAIDAALAVLGSCSGTARLAFFNVRSGDGENGLFWVNPTAPYAATRVLFRTDTYPTGVGDGQAIALGVFPGSAGAVGSTIHAGLDNGTTYYYAAFAEDGSGAASAARRSRGRPDDTSGAFRWAYTIGRPRSVAAVNGFSFPYMALSDDALHALRVGDGGWPSSWKPAAIPAPAAARPTTLPFLIGGQRMSFVGSRSGVLHAVNADSGALVWTSPPLGGQVLSSVSGAFALFGEAADYLFVGVRTPAGGGRFHALDALDGTMRWSFDDGGALGPVLTQPSVSPTTATTPGRVYFTSRARGGSHTVWCLQYAPASFTVAWSANPGDVNTSPTVRGGSVYVGTLAGEVHSLDADDGGVRWPTPYATGDGPLSLFVFRPIGTDRLYFSTANAVHALTDTGSVAFPYWTAPLSLPNPSVPVPVAPNVYVSAADGRLYQIDATSTTPSPIAVSVGDPAAPMALGQLTFDVSNATVIVGSADGIVYGLRFPFGP